MSNPRIGDVQVLSGRLRPEPPVGRSQCAEVRSADPSDTVSLGVQTTDTGSSLLSSRFQVRIEDRDGHADLKMTLNQSWGRGYAVITNTDGQGHATELKVPVGSIGRWAVERFFTPGSPVADIYLDNLQADHVKAIEIEKDGGDGRITFYTTDGRNHGLNVGSSLSLWR